MEVLSYRDQVIWGTSLDMADEDEFELCYKYFKDIAFARRDLHTICSEAISIVSAINSVDPKWRCGNSVKNLKLCDKYASIEIEDLIKLIDGTISDDINVDFEKIINLFKDKGYVDIYRCNRVFFLKDIK